MAVRKQVEERLVVDGERTVWLAKSRAALEGQRVTNITPNEMLYQLSANYKKATVWGTLQVTLIPSGGDKTEMLLIATANVDNAFAIFSSPGKKIIERFKAGL